MKNSAIRVFFSVVIGVMVPILTISAQTDFREGYVITNQIDTIFGLVDYRGDARNAKLCLFKSETNSEIKKYTPKEIFGYRFIDGKYYISKELKINEEFEQVFVEYLLNGIANLYYYRDYYGDHYLIESPEIEIVELTNDKELRQIDTYRQGIVETNKHIGLLKATFKDCWDIQPQIDKAELTHKSLINLTKTYHDYVCDDEICIIYEKKPPLINVRFGASLGYSLSEMSFLYNNLLSSLDMDNSIDPKVGFFVDINSPRVNEKISLQLDVKYGRSYYYGYFEEAHISSKDRYDIHIRTGTINSSLGLKYTYPKGKFRPTINFGLVTNYSLTQDNKLVKETEWDYEVQTYESNDIPIRQILVGPYLQLGCDYRANDKHIYFSKLKYHNCFSKVDLAKTEVQSYEISFGIYL